jgi:hypothetical protein
MAIIASFWAILPKSLQFRTGPIRDRAGKSCQIRPPSRLKDEFVQINSVKSTLSVAKDFLTGNLRGGDF